MSLVSTVESSKLKRVLSNNVVLFGKLKRWSQDPSDAVNAAVGLAEVPLQVNQPLFRIKRGHIADLARAERIALKEFGNRLVTSLGRPPDGDLCCCVLLRKLEHGCVVGRDSCCEILFDLHLELSKAGAGPLAFRREIFGCQSP